MAEFVTVTKELDRMCKHFANCGNCPLAKLQGSWELCRNWITNHPEETERVVMEWSMKNPIVTNRKKLEEVFGFDVALMFEPTTGNYAWLNSEYKNKED